MNSAQTELKPRRSKFKSYAIRTWKPLLIVVVVLVAIHGIATLVMGRRFEADVRAIKAQGDPVSYAALGGPKVPDDQNAAVIYAKAFKLLEDQNNHKSLELIDKFLKGVGSIPTKWTIKPVAWSEAKQAVQQFLPVVSLVQAAVSRPKCQFPIKWDTGPAATFIHLAYVRSLTRVLSAMAVVDAHEGKLDDAYRKVGLAFQVARVSKDEPILISTLVTISSTQTANGALQAVLKYGLPTNSEISKLYSMLSYTDFRREWANGIRGERAMGLWMYNYVLNNGASGYYRLKGELGGSEGPNALERVLLQAASSVWRPMIYADAECYLKYMAANVESAHKDYRFVTQQEKNTEVMLTELPPYAIMTRTLSPIFTRGSAKVDDLRAQTGMTQILLAALQYKSRTGVYPATITKLRSNSAWNIPTDPFSGKDFVYKRTANGFVLYSIGDNLKDDGGRQVPRPYLNKSIGNDIVLNWVM